MSNYQARLSEVNRHAGRAAGSTWEYVGDADNQRSFMHSDRPGSQQQRLDRERSEISTNLQRRPIAAEVLAVKLEAVSRGEFGSMEKQIFDRPEIPEMLWSLQYWSFQPGGLEANIVTPLIELETDRILFPELQSIKPARKGRYTELQIATLLEAAPRELFYALGLDCDFQTFAELAYLNRDRLANPETWKDALLSAIRERLPIYLHQVCQSPAVDFSGKQFQLIPDIVGRLIALMRKREVIEQHSIADTEIFRRVSSEIGFAESQRGLVLIIGDSRIGKTVSAAACVRMRPGRRRYLVIPSTNDMASLYRAFAESLGVFASPNVKAEALRCLVEYVFRVGRFALIADEFHFCLPTQFTRRTKPRRLDWVRTSIFDKGVALIAITTPQDMDGWRRFVSYTQYTQNQFRGRLDQEVFLPSEISEADIGAVARHVLKGCGADAIELVITRAMRCDMGLKVVDAIARRAGNDDRQAISDEDLESAWKELEPSFQFEPLSAQRQASAEADCRTAAAPVQPACTPSETAIQPPRISRGDRAALPAPQPRGSLVPDLVEG